MSETPESAVETEAPAEAAATQDEVGEQRPEVAGSASATPTADAEPAAAEPAEGSAEALVAGAADDDVAEESEDAEDESDDAQDSDDSEEAAPRSAASRRAELEREGEVAADFLESLLDICDLDGDLDVDVDGDRAAVAIVDSDEGRVPRRLVGQNGAVLEALQELTRLAVQSATGVRSRLMLDVAGHRATRRADLVALAKVAIGEVKETGERRSLDPMSAFERKVVHDEVLAAGLVSESEGAEPRRFVVIHPA